MFHHTMIRGCKEPLPPGTTISTDRKCSVQHFCDFYDAAEYDSSSKGTFVCVGCHERFDESEFQLVDWDTIRCSRDMHAPDGWD